MDLYLTLVIAFCGMQAAIIIWVIAFCISDARQLARWEREE